uniref:Uncharacterized protein n=1 Tax=Physcomitrium patens TaxID=3218 RepID=A0A7I3Z2Z8_PHYPA
MPQTGIHQAGVDDAPALLESSSRCFTHNPIVKISAAREASNPKAMRRTVQQS